MSRAASNQPLPKTARAPSGDRAELPVAAGIDEEVRSWLAVFRQTTHWVVCAHVTPDADTLGSALALGRLLEGFGHRVVVACADPVLPLYGFMPGAEKVVSRLPPDWPATFGAVTLDVPELSRLGSLAPLLGKARPLVNMDHHVSNPRFGTHVWVDLGAAATGELVAQLYAFFGEPFDAETAGLLYAALVTDTGFFRYSATSPRTLAIASALLAAGAPTQRIIAQLYEQKSAAALRVGGAAIAALRQARDGRIAYAAVSRAMFDAAGATDDDAEGIVEALRDLRGVEVWFVAREQRDGGVRFSLRARPHCDVSAVAACFGGGGHRVAAGCTVVAPLDEAVGRVLAAIEKSL